MRRPPLTVRLLVVLLGAMSVWALTSWLNDTVVTGDLTVPVRAMNAVLISALAVPLVVVARRRLDRRPWAGLGLDRLSRAARPSLWASPPSSCRRRSG